jgi:isocitrate/isopropylmalate dehydrogenase
MVETTIISSTDVADRRRQVSNGHRVAYLRGGPGDESGPEMADAAMVVLEELLAAPDAPNVEFVPVRSGFRCYEEEGTSLPADSLATILGLGVAFKAPNASAKTVGERPLSLVLRSELGTFASVNPIRSYAGVPRVLSSPEIDVVLVRDNSEGLFGVTPLEATSERCVDPRVVSRAAAERVARVACTLARERRGRVTVCAFPVGIPSDRLFIDACEAAAAEVPGITLDVRKVDAFAGTVLTMPERYDVVVAPNEWGSIMTDCLAAAAGAVGITARGNIGDGTAYFEPIHGTAPGKAGKGTVNPVSQILAGALLLEWLGRERSDEAAARAARRLRTAVTAVLERGLAHTSDLGGTTTTAEVVSAVVDELRAPPPSG